MLFLFSWSPVSPLLEPSVPTLFLRSVLIVVFKSHVHFTVHLIFFTVNCDLSHSEGHVSPSAVL